MCRSLVVLTLGLIGLAVVYRDRLYLRDPLGKIVRNDAEQADAAVYINYENDVLVREKHGAEMFVVQHWNRLQAFPGRLTCIEGMLCLLPADRVLEADGTRTAQRPAEMSDREVSFTDASGARVKVTIR